MDLEPLSELRQLEVLSLTGCDTAPGAFEALGGLRGLRAISLPRNATDEDLRGCRDITDLAPLAGLQRLKSLELDQQTGVSEETLKAFEEAAPECRVRRL